MITAIIDAGQHYCQAVSDLWQWDYGQTLRIQGVKLPAAVEVQFSTTERIGETVTRIGVTQEGVTEVPIPDTLLEGSGTTQDYTIYAFVYIENGDSGKTEYRVSMKVRARPKPEAHATPEEGELFRQAIVAVAESADRAESARKSAETSADEAKTAKENAETAAKVAEAFKTEAETARSEAVRAATESTDAKDSAEKSRAAAEKAKQDAEAAKAAAEESAEKAETAKEEIQESADQIQKNATEIDSLKEDLDNVNETLLDSIFVESKNRYNKATSIIGTINMQGDVREDASSMYLVSDYILLKSGKIYALSYYHTGYNKQYGYVPNRLVCFDLTKSFLYQTTSFQNMTENDYISYVSGTNENGEIYRAITPKQDLYVRFQTGKNFTQIMLQIGTDMIYENYFEDYYKVSLKKDIVAKENLTKELQEKIDSINSFQTEIDKIPVLENKVNPILESYDFNSIYSKIHRNVLFIGDSLTEGYQYKDKIYKDKSYPAFLSRMCDWQCTNKGQSGITTLNWWKNQGQTVDFTLYDAVFIYLGTNGGLTDTIDTDTASGDYNTFAETNTGGYCAIIAKIRDINPNCKIYIIKYGNTTISNITQAIADKYNCDVITVMDTAYFTLSDSKYHTGLTHYNTLGYYCFALNVLWQVEKIIKSKLDSYTAN